MTLLFELGEWPGTPTSTRPARLAAHTTERPSNTPASARLALMLMHVCPNISVTLPLALGGWPGTPTSTWPEQLTAIETERAPSTQLATILSTTDGLGTPTSTRPMTILDPDSGREHLWKSG